MANRYWIGNSGLWHDTAHWSASSGGAGGESRPTSSDNAFFDANSFTLTGQVVTIVNLGSGYCLNMDWTGVLNSPGLDFLSSSGDLNIYGSLTLASNVSVFSPKYLYFTGAAAKSITTNGLTISPLAVYFSQGVITLQDDLTVSGLATIYLDGSAGATTLNTNGKTVKCAIFHTAVTSASTLTLGNSAINVTSFVLVTTNLTFNANTSTITITAIYNISGGFYGGGSTYNNVNIVANSTMAGSNTISSLTVSPGKTLTITQGTTQTVTTLTLDGNPDQIITLKSSVAGTAATISKVSGIVTAKWCSIKDSIVSGGATFNAYHSTNVSGNTGWNFIINYASLVSGYIPLYYADKNPDGTGGGQIDELNYIQSAFKETFSGNATATTFYMSFGSLTTGDNVIIVNNATLTSGGVTAGFGVNYASGYFTLTTAATSGIGSVEITTHKPVLEATCITNCTFCDTYGEGNDTNVFLSGNRSFPARVFWSYTSDPTYFPATSYADVGVKNDKMMGFLKTTNTLILLKYNSIHAFVGVPPNNAITEMYEGEGLIATDTAKIVDGIPTFLSQRGVVQLLSGNGGYRLELISEDVNGIPNIRNGIITETLANRELAFAWVFQNKYWLWLNGTIWVYQYNLKRQEQGKTVYPWIPWKAFTNTACFADKDNYLYFGDNYNLFKFDPTANSDNGTAIDAFWLGKKLYPSGRNIVNAYTDIYWNVSMISGIATSSVDFSLYVSGASSVKSTTYTPTSSYVDYSVRHPFAYRSNSIQYMIRENSVSGGFSFAGLDITTVPVRKLV